jgi:hypothetical protein
MDILAMRIDERHARYASPDDIAAKTEATEDK